VTLFNLNISFRCLRLTSKLRHANAQIVREQLTAQVGKDFVLCTLPTAIPSARLRDLMSDLRSRLLRKIMATPLFISELFIGLVRSGTARAKLHVINAVTALTPEMTAHLNDSD